jgi:hypothetical protein
MSLRGGKTLFFDTPSEDYFRIFKRMKHSKINYRVYFWVEIADRGTYERRSQLNVIAPAYQQQHFYCALKRLMDH